nr:MAG TPA: Capsid protein [Microviridae sp.]
MNRNNERHFNQIPEMHASRTRFNRDQTVLTTFDSGKLIPYYVDEVLPGDTFNVKTTAIIRMTTPKYPVFDDAFIDFYYFFCPNRILWDNFKYFMGEVEDTPWMPKKTYTVPKIKLENTQKSAIPFENSILDYMGVPTKSIITPENKTEINALPVRAYVKIWNEFFRDQNVDNAAVLKTNDESVTYTDNNNEENTSIESKLKAACTGGRCLPVNKYHDYFTSCLPYPQRGPAVTIPITGNAAIRMGGSDGTYQEFTNTIAMTLGVSTASNKAGALTYGKETGTAGEKAQFMFSGTNLGTGSTGNNGWMYADLSSINATTINELRNAIAVQQYYEALARGGSRYREQVQALWNVTISDKTVQVPEYLGGGRYHININQIIQTSGQQTNNDTPIGETGAMSVTPINESSFTKSFEEHGFVIGVCCVRHNRSYQQGLERFWSRSDRLDYYVPQFANIGEQPVKKKEIYLTGKSTDEETFGYQEAWADLRMKPNRVSGLMRSNATGTLDFWHYADNYKEVPTLSQSWMKEGKAEIARTLIVQNEPQFFGAIRIANKTTRRMPLYSVPGLYKL